jgi:hypothetical protein
MQGIQIVSKSIFYGHILTSFHSRAFTKSSAMTSPIVSRITIQKIQLKNFAVIVIDFTSFSFRTIKNPPGLYQIPIEGFLKGRIDLYTAHPARDSFRFLSEILFMKDYD